MRILGIAIALAVAGMSPAAAQAPAATTTVVDHSAQVAAPATAAAPAGPALIVPTPGVGQPDGRIGLQDQVTPIGVEAANFHNHWLVTLCVLISLFVLALLVVAIVKFRRGANPTPSRNSHNTLLEVVWTIVPVLVLVAIAVPSIRLLRHQYSPPKADVTIKVVGNQWYWTYSYPDNGGFEIVSNMLKEARDVKPGERFRTPADGPPLLAVDERIVIPVHRVVKFLVTSNDVIHSFAVPAFWTKMDAVPGRVNETWVKVDRPGVYFGQCSELCGARHGFMPIAVEVVSDADYAKWIASKGGTMPGAKPATGPDTTAASPVALGGTPVAVPPQVVSTTAAAPTGAAPAKPTTAPSQGVPDNNR
ncbi:MAG: cytochrome c oxidase subunit II [Sphingomicrobium sp.]|nr:cytochrome c oxidase subunit II [Sphingomonadales bacterium]